MQGWASMTQRRFLTGCSASGHAPRQGGSHLTLVRSWCWSLCPRRRILGGWLLEARGLGWTGHPACRTAAAAQGGHLMEIVSPWLNWYPMRLYAPVVELYSESGYTLREAVVTATEPVLPYSWGARAGGEALLQRAAAVWGQHRTNAASAARCSVGSWPRWSSSQQAGLARGWQAGMRGSCGSPCSALRGWTRPWRTHSAARLRPASVCWTPAQTPARRQRPGSDPVQARDVRAAASRSLSLRAQVWRLITTGTGTKHDVPEAAV